MIPPLIFILRISCRSILSNRYLSVMGSKGRSENQEKHEASYLWRMSVVEAPNAENVEAMGGMMILGKPSSAD